MGNANSHRPTADHDYSAFTKACMEERRAVHIAAARYRKQAWQQQMEQQMARPAPEPAPEPAPAPAPMNFDDFAEESAAYLNTH